jgi:glycosyltransferase involved in cell wall biosynthesis
MKKVFIGLFLLLVLGGLFLFLSRSNGKYLQAPQFFTERFIHKNYNYPVLEQKPFVFVVYSVNSIDTCEKNLSSIFEQEYENFRVIYIDDGSSDGTSRFVKEFAQKCGKEKSLTIFRNEKKRGMTASLFDAIHSCKNHEIVLLVEGKDWLAHRGVLTLLNETYANPDIWLTYGQYVSYPSYRKGICSSFSPFRLEKYGFRGHAWVASHLKTFYAGLFKNIWLEDLLFENKWIDRCVEMAILLPMLEMAKEGHFAFLEEILYICNEEIATPRDRFDLIAENAVECFLRNLHQREPLLFLHPEQSVPNVADIVIFSLDRCMQLWACLESIEQYVTGVHKVFVIYRSTSAKFQKSYEELKKRFRNVTFIQQLDNPYENFKPIILENIFRLSKANFVMFGVDSSLVKDKIDLSTCIEMMEKTHAYGFFFRLGHLDFRWDAPPCIPLSDHVFAWQISKGEKEWNSSHDLHLTLYRKSSITQDFVEMTYKDPNQLRRNWAMWESEDPRLIGLCFDTTKTLHMSGYRNKVFLSPDEFESLFEEGLKINTKQIVQIKNRSAHIDCEMEFVKR